MRFAVNALWELITSTGMPGRGFYISGRAAGIKGGHAFGGEWVDDMGR
jgi:hypothetical protein